MHNGSIIIFGNTGSGKSTLGNLLMQNCVYSTNDDNRGWIQKYFHPIALHKNIFATGSGNRCTGECKGVLHNSYYILDTPGIYEAGEAIGRGNMFTPEARANIQMQMGKSLKEIGQERFDVLCITISHKDYNQELLDTLFLEANLLFDDKQLKNAVIIVTQVKAGIGNRPEDYRTLTNSEKDAYINRFKGLLHPDYVNSRFDDGEPLILLHVLNIRAPVPTHASPKIISELQDFIKKAKYRNNET